MAHFRMNKENDLQGIAVFFFKVRGRIMGEPDYHSKTFNVVFMIQVTAKPIQLKSPMKEEDFEQ